MANAYFQFKQFTVHQQHAAMKVTTDGCLFGAWCASEMKNEELKINNCLDVGAGTGLLALMVAQKNACTIDAVEIDEGAYAEASKNIKASPWQERIQLHHSDINVFPGKHYDCIISNPPFYENELASGKGAKDVAHHSKSLQLDQLFKIINDKLNKDGSFCLLLPFKRREEALNLLEKNELYPSTILSVKQTPAHPPFRILIKGRKMKGEVQLQELIIKDENNHYTEDFVTLLKDYYLYL